MLPWLILLLLLAAGAAVAFYYWQTRLNVPHLSHILLPAYEIPDVILVSGVMVENRGRQPAPNVKITIQFPGDAAAMIHHLKVQSAENTVLRSGGERFSFATVSLRSLRPHGTVFMYWAAAHDVQPKVNVTSYQPPTESVLNKLLPRKSNA